MIKCEYCGKSFKRETSAAVHMCEKKRRWMQKDYPETIAGFTAYDLFYRLGMQSKPKNYQEFVDSQYYSAFVKFGSYCINTRVIDTESYTRWLIRKQAKLKDWATDRMYANFVQEHLKKETVERALERFVEHASETSYFETFWESASGYLIADWVESGKISPWVLVCSNRAKRAVSSMNSEQLMRLSNCIDADYWDKKIKQNPVDAQWVKKIIDGVEHNA
jgi:hypothetical protein